MGKAAPALPLREATATGWASRYRLFWRGCEWQPFMVPAVGGFDAARLAPECLAATSQLMDQPGVYELALVKGKDSKRYKVYVGQTCSLRRRLHCEYRGRGGSHLRPFFDEALANGCQVWRRCRHTATAEEARKQEARLLAAYDYAWNQRQAGCTARHVDVLRTRCCCSVRVRLVARPAGGPHALHADATGG